MAKSCSKCKTEMHERKDKISQCLRTFLPAIVYTCEQCELVIWERENKNILWGSLESSLLVLEEANVKSDDNRGIEEERGTKKNS